MPSKLFRPLFCLSVAATGGLTACSADRAMDPTLTVAPTISAQVVTAATVIVPGTPPGSFTSAVADTSGRQLTEFWDNRSADVNSTSGVNACNIGFFALGSIRSDCINAAAGSYGNRGGYTKYFGDGTGSRDATAFSFAGGFEYTVTLKGSYAGGGSVVGWYTRVGTVYTLHPVQQWSDRNVIGAVPVTINTGGANWGFYIKSTLLPDAESCDVAGVYCSEADGGFDGTPRNQFALFTNTDESAFLVGAEDNRLELFPGAPDSRDSDYNDYIWTVVPTPQVAPVCDFITFGRLVTQVGGKKVVISGNAGGNQPGGGILGEFHIDVNGVDNHVSVIDSYGAITSGVFSSLPNSRIVTGVAKNGNAVELRLWDGGEPGKGTDKVYVKIGGVEVLAPAGQFIDQGNMQYHPVCRGPK